MVACWSCGAEREERAFCPSCEKIQPTVAEESPFSLLGLPPRMGLSRGEVDKAFREASRKVHPDNFGDASAVERRLAVERTAAVNEAYQRIKAKSSRAELLLSLRGLDVNSEQARDNNPMFLMEMIERQEAVEAASSLDALDSLRAEIKARQRAAMGEAEALFDRGEGSEAALLKTLQEQHYDRRLLEQLERREGELS